MAVNALVTGLIVFRILKVFLKVNATLSSVERALDSTGGTTLRYIIFVIIESGMALFAIQLVRAVLSMLPVELHHEVLEIVMAPIIVFSNLVIGINKMFIVIMRSVHFISFIFTDKIYLY